MDPMNDREPISQRGRTRLLVRHLSLYLGVVLSIALAGRGAMAADPAPSAAPPPGVPVSVAKATKGDVPVLMTGIGTVQALNSVLVRARVDGTLDSVAFIEGQEVKKGDLLAVIDPRPYQALLDQAIAKRATDQAQLANAQLDLQRYSNLVKSDFASRQQMDTQAAMVRQLTATLQGDEAMIEAAALNVSFTHITSPLDGRVGLRLVDPGNLVHASDAGGLVTIAQVHPIAVVFTLPEEDLPAISDAMAKGTLPVFAFVAGKSSKLADGTLLTPDNAIDTSTGTIRLKAVFPNADNRLWPGQFVDSRLQVAVRHDAVSVPVAAVQRGQDGLFVYVLKPDQTVNLQVVQEAFEQDGNAVITQGLQGDETVVINGQSRLTSGTRVAVNAAQPGSGS